MFTRLSGHTIVKRLKCCKSCRVKITTDIRIWNSYPWLKCHLKPIQTRCRNVISRYSDNGHLDLILFWAQPKVKRMERVVILSEWRNRYGEFSGHPAIWWTSLISWCHVCRICFVDRFSDLKIVILNTCLIYISYIMAVWYITKIESNVVNQFRFANY